MSQTNHAGGPGDIDLGSAEFQDYPGPAWPAGLGVDLRHLLSAESLRGLAAVIVAILVLRSPSQSPRAFGVLMGLILIAWAIGAVFDLRKPSRRSGWAWVRTLSLISAGAALLFVDSFTPASLARALGVGLIVAGIWVLITGLRGASEGSRTEILLGALLYVALGAALLAAPVQVLGLAVILLSAFWFVTGLVTVVTNVRLDDRQIAPSNTWQMLFEWVQTRPSTADDRLQLYEKIFFEGEEQPRRLSRFFALMGFATAIAAFGIIADSTAVVIGAMLVAPLMTPLMGTALAMAMGWPRRALMSIGVAVAGIGFAVALGVIFGWVYGPEISSVTNTQVASRIAPTLVDLIIAVAAGGAGAFALSRPDVSDSLPGVAVAIALVPPLAVAGLMLSQAQWAAASGAMLLFTTNLVAILLVGGLVFILTGVVPVLQMVERRNYLKMSLGMVAILAIAVITVLGVSAQTFRRQTAGLATADQVVSTWLMGTDLLVSSATYADDTYRVVLAGTDEPPPIGALADAIEDAFDTEIALEVTWVPTRTFTFDPGG